MVTNIETITTSFQDPKFVVFVLAITLWEMIWKGLALWKASQNNQRNWFVVMLFVNSMGILPILYLKFFQKKKS